MLAVAKIKQAEASVGVIDAPSPTLSPGHVLIQITAAGICGTDMAIYNWAPRMQSRIDVPRILGHEATGKIIGIGSGVQGLEVGDRVSLESHIFCGICHYCRRGDAHLCEHLGYPGISIDGGFAELVSVPAQIVRVVPQNIDDNTAAMIEPFGIAVHACMSQRGTAGKTVLVNGCGPIGLMTVAAAKALGARRILAVDPNPIRLALAKEFGADEIVDPTSIDVSTTAKRMTGGYGVEVAIEYSGVPSGLDSVLASLERMADLRLVAGPAHPHALDVNALLRTGLSIYGIHGRRLWQDWDLGVKLLEERKVDLSALADPVLPMSRAIEGFEAVNSGRALKPILLNQ